MSLKLGVYKHFKGHIYIVKGIAKHSETLEEYVIYSRQNNPDDVWIRPLSMFLEEVELNGTLVKRFLFIGVS